MTARPRLGAVLWVLVVQYFVLLPVVESQWTTPYRWMTNAISDLGAATCFASASSGWVCSPWHVLAGASWTVAGLCLAGGAVLIRPWFPATRTARAGLVLYVVAGLGLVVVGLSPEDTATVPHTIGALLAIAGGEAAMLLTGLALARTVRWRRPGLIVVGAAIVAILGFVIMVAQVGGPELFGLWERIAAFPILVWAIACGAMVLARPTPSAERR